MKLTIENTTKVVMLSDDSGRINITARIWEGHTESGIPVHCYIARVAVASEENQEQFERELTEVRRPSAAVAAIPLRLII